MKALNRLIALAAMAAGLWPVLAMAQAPAYPTKPIKVIVTWPPGSAPDILARMVAQDLSDNMGSALVENKPGFSGVLGAEYVAKSAADGYTLLMGQTATLTINPALYGKVPYDTMRDFAPVSMVAYAPFVLVVANNVPAKNMRELIAQAKAAPGKLSFATAGSGSMNDICVQLVKGVAGMDLLHVPYKGIALGIPDVIEGRVSMMCNSAAAMLPHIKAGKMRAIATVDAKRSAVLPDLPTVAEAGLAGSEVASWYAIYGPAGLPAGITQKLHAQIGKMLVSQKARERFAELGLNAASMTPEELGEVTRRDLQKWTKVIRDNNIKPD
jgi:tripartite-type tricarboxylate transporter receptor subunit TctC